MNSSKHTTLTLSALGFTAIAVHAAIVVTPDHIVSGSATGTLVAIDVPFVPNGITGGPDWTADADDGFQTVNDPVQDYQINQKLWEPDGTPASEAGSYFTYPNGPEPGVKWVFNQAASGIDIPDGAVINAIYAVWFGRGRDGITYRYTEGAASGNYVDSQGSASLGDLVLSWTDDGGTVRNGNFQRIFSGPIVVEGGDGFELWGTDNVGNAAHVDAIVIDITLPAAGAPTIASVHPADDADNIPLNSPLVATFDKPVELTGAGTVTIYDTVTMSNHEDIALPDLRVSASGFDLTITPDANLSVGTNYAVLISSDAVKNLNSVDTFAGISDPDVWDFTTTTDGTPPTAASTDPADDVTDIPPFADLVATFSEDIVLTGAGTVTIRNAGLGSDEIVITLPDEQVSVAGVELTINPTAHLAGGTEYAVRISSDAVKDLNDNLFAGIADDTTWSFTTTAPPSGGVEVTPDHIVSSTFGVTGTLLAIDVPFNDSTGSGPAFGGPDWPEDADDGFTAPTAAGDGLRGPDNNTGGKSWEPDGTPLAEATGYFTFGNGPAPSVTWTFDLPDGVVINAVYANFGSRGSSDGCTYQYSEGAASDSAATAQNPGPSARDLVLNWKDSDNGLHEANFQRIFVGPITVEGGDGFALWGTDNIGNAAHIDAVVIDVGSGSGDYFIWADGFPGVDLSDPNADSDRDGLSNDNERLFGLDPTDPASVNPILIPLNTATGTLSFTRRNDALTGKFARMETSTDLVMWTEDSGATLAAGAPDANDIETVSVTLSPGLLNAPTLFVRIVQDDGVIFSTNFEDDNGGFTPVGTPNDWAWGAPNSDNDAGLILTTGNGGSANCWGTKLGDGTVPSSVITADADSILRSPNLDLTAVTAADLRFAAAVDANTGDTLQVVVKEVGTGTVLDTITPITPPATADWAKFGPFALPAAAGKNVHLVFRFQGADTAYIGLYIDDVTVSKALP